MDRIELADGDRRMLEFARRLTIEPGSLTATDAQALRDAGLSDRAILDVTLVTAYFNFVNRIAQGLGVELEDDPGCSSRCPGGKRPSS